MRAKNKREMAAYLADAMDSSYRKYRAEQKLERDTGLLKSYLIEAHVSNKPESVHEATRACLEALTPSVRIRVFDTEDETLFNLVHGQDTYYLDVSDSRFWIMHTLTLSTRADKLREKLIRESPLLDSAWLPTQLLERISGLGYFKGFGITHDETLFLRRVTDESEVETMHLRLWGGGAGRVLQALRESRVFPYSLALSSVRLKYWLPGLEEEAVIDNLTFEGKATALGKSFAGHTSLVSSLYSEYAETIRSIEEHLAIRFTPSDGAAVLHGHPIIVNLSRHLSDIRGFAAKVFSCTLPFRLWGLSEVYGDDFTRVYAVDLHVGHKLTFEIARDFIRIYLPHGSCGNTIARFYTNLQQYYDSGASISGGNREQLF